MTPDIKALHKEHFILLFFYYLLFYICSLWLQLPFLLITCTLRRFLSSSTVKPETWKCVDQMRRCGSLLQVSTDFSAVIQRFYHLQSERMETYRLFEEWVQLQEAFPDDSEVFSTSMQTEVIDWGPSRIKITRVKGPGVILSGPPFILIIDLMLSCSHF